MENSKEETKSSRGSPIVLVYVAVTTALVISLGSLYFSLAEFRESSNSNSIEAEIVHLKKEIDRLDRDIDQVRSLATKLSSTRKVAVLSPSILEKYDTMESDVGVFLVSLQDVQPYMDGYSLTLKIANLTAVTWSGFTLQAEWGEQLFSFDSASGVQHKENFLIPMS